MDKDRLPLQENAAENKTDAPAFERGKRAAEPGSADHAIKDDLEDDVVREVLKLHSRGKRP